MARQGTKEAPKTPPIWRELLHSTRLDQPAVVLLTISKDEYNELKTNPNQFLVDHGIFEAHRVHPNGALFREGAPIQDGEEVQVVVVHEPECCSTLVARNGDF
jgi:hypothetical protein